MWLPLTFALNQVTRSMGRRDLHPFLLAPTVIEKLRPVHRLVRDCDRQSGALPPSGQVLATAFGTAGR